MYDRTERDIPSRVNFPEKTQKITLCASIATPHNGRKACVRVCVAAAGTSRQQQRHNTWRTSANNKNFLVVPLAAIGQNQMVTYATYVVLISGLLKIPTSCNARTVLAGGLTWPVRHVLDLSSFSPPPTDI